MLSETGSEQVHKKESASTLLRCKSDLQRHSKYIYLGLIYLGPIYLKKSFFFNLISLYFTFTDRIRHQPERHEQSNARVDRSQLQDKCEGEDRLD